MPQARQVVGITNESVSYLPLPPPIWARIPSDLPSPAITPFSTPPPIIPLDSVSASCSCRSGDDRERYNPFAATEQKACIIYDLNEAWESVIDLQRCTLCKVRFVGPDCRSVGLFNWNNRILLSHQLLDEYSSAFTTSETPFVAWVSVASRRYQTKRPNGLGFLSEKIFRAAWFSYTRLLQLNGDMLCPRCGPTPKAIIFDGVSLAFNRKNVLNSLCPPTKIHSESAIRENVVRSKRLQCIQDAALRKNIRKILNGPSLYKSDLCASQMGPVNNQHISDDEISHESGSSEEEEVRLRNDSRRKTATLLKQRALVERFKLIPDVVDQLKIINPDLAAVFNKYFGIDSIMERKEPPTVYIKLFIQVRNQYHFEYTIIIFIL